METDKTTLNDLSIFQHEEAFSIFSRLNFTRTTGGRERLKALFSSSLPDIAAVLEVQDILRLIIDRQQEWPFIISNGSIMVIHKFYETIFEAIPSRPAPHAAYLYKLLHGADYSLARYSAGHAFDFIKGMQQLVTMFLEEGAPAPLDRVLQKARLLVQKPQLDAVARNRKLEDLSPGNLLALTHFFRYHYRQQMEELIELYFQLDAWYGMAMAVQELKLVFPTFIPSDEPELKIRQLYHMLLQDPVAYDLDLNQHSNFIFLTGANMAGKSTFIKAVGVAVFLAHIGMGVPAGSMELSFFDGLLSNINVVDNLVKGESYFYNEVQRIKKTILRVNDGRKWLILIDELFKGTNVQDAMKCSTVVIEGLIRIRSSLFILSTHLYEIGEALKGYPNISFKYFETLVEEDRLSFNYQLREGISNDRLGYLILKREKVIEMLEKL